MSHVITNFDKPLRLELLQSESEFLTFGPSCKNPWKFCLHLKGSWIFMHLLSRPAPPQDEQEKHDIDPLLKLSPVSALNWWHAFCRRWPGATGVMTHNAASLLSNQGNENMNFRPVFALCNLLGVFFWRCWRSMSHALHASLHASRLSMVSDHFTISAFTRPSAGFGHVCKYSRSWTWQYAHCEHCTLKYWLY